ncbi:hypothetical protein CcaverHIS002_0608330 [Cutaneotrichosporon cavernicola]|uniref:Protein YAE1 n=1 Tax=Cutaneotrichosporon cavernicola TaxID=279322 RepID=A0AA48QY59_9TREE|nr:uncharacterized protein CcaverHIS019_0607780 [Cutaneotrichosporon cavernicola]BEI86546.1 hypothetical protein CcaverHIS002_0608330 [Cutaneotrichosporon cavernicola]BEI94319.1 hypothetical protein CcaverHIS019_0607780 [Cutaneotrichosporon cavernicola]BEJ02096.1 hypothetical protein CcaverHIS631_0607780 [Cutaneotrichosporon cavernicola]BEJ09859.1 hypothetical protein CcaverHIS641_0607740 [Cutaneotrichosporon cavernicola]
MDTDDFHDVSHSLSHSQGGVSDPLVDTEYARLQQRYTDAGYREGIGEGKLSTLQSGFDEGFATSVPPARTVGQLRGRAAALLAIALSQEPSQESSHESSQEVQSLRALVADLAAVRRDDVLAPDHEAVAHEAEHHDADDYAFEYDRNERRDMEGLERGMEGIGGRKEGLREEALLASLETRVDEAEARVLA